MQSFTLFKKKFIYLFIYLAASGLSCGTRDLSLWRVALHCGAWASLIAVCRLLFSCVRAPEHVGSVVVAHGLSSCGAQALECMGSVVAACRLSYPAACGILVPQPGIEPMFSALEGRFLTTGPPGKSQCFTLSYKNCCKIHIT